MTSSLLDIANRALEDVNATPIDALTDDSKNARLCNRRLPQLRDALLRLHPWNFAKTRALLPALATPPVWGWTHQFQLPPDNVRLLIVQDHWDHSWAWGGLGPCSIRPPDDFVVEGQMVLTRRRGPLRVGYISNAVPSGLWDPLFVDTLVASLALNICMPLTNDKSLFGTLEEIFESRLAAARGIANLETGDHTEEPYAILAVRL